MDNHYHLMIETPEGNLSIGMRQLNGIYTQKYNRRHNKPGHLFQGRFKAILVQRENYLLELCRYVVLNPVRAGMIEKPEDWKWSSYLSTAGLRKKPCYLATDWISNMFDRKRIKAQKQYRVFVQEGIHRRTPWMDLQSQILLGEEGFIDSVKDLLEGKKVEKEIPRLQRYVDRPTLNNLFKGQKMRGEERDAGIYTAHMNYGYGLKEIADYLGIHYTTVSKVIARAVATRK
jgi:hypothetical protein